MTKIKQIFNWLDNNLLIILCGFLLAFIPLYPKIPLWSPIEQYIVRVRVEDLVILFSAFIYTIQVLRKKARWYSPMFWGILIYEIVAVISMLSAFFIIKTVPLYPLHIGKTVLHFFRYVEYFALFFIAFGAIKTRQQVKILLGIFCATVVAISLYGYGQKYLYWPVYSTMNREFSKGMVLYLTQYARVQSTFGGHYDMGAYLVIALPLILALALHIKSIWLKRGLWLGFWLGSWLLILSASRTPFAAYVFGTYLVLLIFTLLQPTWKAKFQTGIKKGLAVTSILFIIVYYFGNDLIIRLGFFINSQPQMAGIVAILNDTRKKVLPDQILAYIPSPEKVQSYLPKKTTPPSQGVSTDDLAAQLAAAQEEVEITQDVASSQDQPPIALTQPTPKVVAPPIFKGPTTPVDVVEEIPDIVEVATVSATGETTIVKKKKPRVYSKCAMEKELSLCIRQEVLWPRALEGFLTNPIVGTGYATLTKESVDVFTEADSTDNNFLRTLGETGLLGFISFYGCVVIILIYAVKNITNTDRLKRSLSLGILGGSIGLLINAVYIDVFASSKVAETYWALAGLLIGYLTLPENQLSVTANSVEKLSAPTAITSKSKLNPIGSRKQTRNKKSKKSKK